MEIFAHCCGSTDNELPRRKSKKSEKDDIEMSKFELKSKRRETVEKEAMIDSKMRIKTGY